MTESTVPELDALVHRTSGPQPYRRLFHAACGLAIAAAVVWLPLPRSALLAIGGGAFLIQLASDLLRSRMEAANRLFYTAFRHLASPRDADGLASSTWYTLGVLLALAFFPQPAAVSGILILALADPVASYLGRRYGRRPFLGGSVEGSLVFLLAALAILGLRHPPLAAVPTAILATLAERRSWPLDDNLTLAPVTAAGLTFMQLMLG